MKIRIYVMTHKKFEMPQSPLFRPLHVGRACGEDLGYPGDDTGENISDKNCYYSELTGLYWVWKNCHDVDYVGTCHYRRYLLGADERILMEDDYEKLLSEYDLITTKQVALNNSYYYGFCANHNKKALDAAGEVIKERYPAYYPAFERLVHGTRTYFGNMFVTSKELYDSYCSWLFSIFAEVEKRICLETGEDAYHKRVFGFISEFLLLVWVTVQGLSVCECKVGMIGEKAETREMKEQLAGYFARCDVDGARAYFLERRKERPDVLMEASDVTGELRLCMQVIATAGMEQTRYGTNLLERENRFKELMQMFDRLDQIVYRYRNGLQKKEDAVFLKEQGITDTALLIALRIPGDDAARQKELFAQITADKKALDGTTADAVTV